MTREEKKRLLAEIEKQYKWLMTKSPTIYMIDIAFDAIRKAVRDEAEQEPKISLDTYKQVAKERDIAIEQLHELGYEFGEKIPTTQERQAESDRFDAAFQDGYNNGYAQARFDYKQEPTTKNDLEIVCQYTDEEISKAFIEDVEAVKDQLPKGQQMEFPDTFDEFAKDYGFKDEDEIYTNGSELIPVFRVKQWLAHMSTTKNDSAVDCISRADAIRVASGYCHPSNVAKELAKLPSMGRYDPYTDKFIKE